MDKILIEIFNLFLEVGSLWRNKLFNSTIIQSEQHCIEAAKL